MRQTLFWILLVLGSALVAPAAHAGKGGGPVAPTMTNQKLSDNQAFIGLQWNFGVRNGASVVVGYRWAKVTSDDKVNGGQIAFNYAITGTTGPGELRLNWLSGTRSAQGELGLGYSFHAASFLANAAVQGSYVYGGIDYLVNKGFQPYIGVNTVHYKRVPYLQTCPLGTTLGGGNCVNDDD